MMGPIPLIRKRRRTQIHFPNLYPKSVPGQICYSTKTIQGIKITCQTNLSTLDSIIIVIGNSVMEALTGQVKKFLVDEGLSTAL